VAPTELSLRTFASRKPVKFRESKPKHISNNIALSLRMNCVEIAITVHNEIEEVSGQLNTQCGSCSYLAYTFPDGPKNALKNLVQQSI
jgi:hypothetical protein